MKERLHRTMGMVERVFLGQPRLAASGTLGCPQNHHQHTDEVPRLGPSCAFLGGGKRGREDEVWIDEKVIW